MRAVVVFLAFAIAAACVTAGVAAPSRNCTPTRADSLGPFYEPGAPRRAKVGSGYALSGVVRSTRNCRPLAGARVEFWLAGPDGEYGDAWRATVVSGRGGRYRFQSHFPPPYSGRPSHIHIRVSAARHRTLVTQHYPRRGMASARFNLTLRPR